MSDSLNQWQTCEPGHLKRVVWRLQNQRVYRALRRDIAVGTVLVACILSGYVGIDAWANQPADLGGILCFEVSKLRDVVVRGGSLVPEHRQCMQRHLAICAHCREGMELARAQYEQAHAPDSAQESPPADRRVASRAAYFNPVLSTVGF
jgi:hypothetical protein